MSSGDQPIQYLRYSSLGWEQVDARIIVESSVTLTVNGAAWLSFMCTPVLLEELAVGFLYNEGLIQSKSEIVSVHLCENGTNVDVWLDHALQKPQNWRRTTGCTGGWTSSTPAAGKKAAQVGTLLSPQVILDSMDKLFHQQEIYRKARGIHCSVLFDGQKVHFQAEDIGRHNTLDKLAGMHLLNPIQIEPAIVLTTGRVSSEMLQKSSRLGASIVISRTAASSVAVETARSLDITLIGYARRNSFQLYTHPERIDMVQDERVAPVPLAGD